MDEKEAKKILERLLSVDILVGNEKEAVSVAIKALERQIAKKPLLVPVEGTYVHHEYVCPNCRNYASDYLKSHHCKCGQKLDWDEV